MGPGFLSSPAWQRPLTLFFIMMALIMAQVITQDTPVTSTVKIETESVAPQLTAVAPLRRGRPRMVSNSTQTEDYEPTEEPVLITGMILAVAAACSAVLAIIVLIVIVIIAIRCYWDRPSKAPPFGPQFNQGDSQSYVPVYVDRKMAQSAQMFFYQFQKQQLLAQESEQKSRHSADSDSCSEAETKEGHMPIVSCPGLAMKNGDDLEVRNPMFFEDVPTWDGSVATDDEESHYNGRGGERIRSLDETDPERFSEGRPPSTGPGSETPQISSSSSPYPPPTTPSSSTPTPPTGMVYPSSEREMDAKATDVNKNLTSSSAEVKSRDVTDVP